MDARDLFLDQHAAMHSAAASCRRWNSENVHETSAH